MTTSKHASILALVSSFFLVHCGSDPSTPPTGPGASGGAAGAGGAGAAGGAGGAGGSSFTCETIGASTPVANIFHRFKLADLPGPAYASAGDINGDGRKDIVISSIGPVSTENGVITLSPALVTAFLRGEGIDCWQKVDIIKPEDKFFFPGKTTIDDIDGDGDLDIAIAFGFFVCQFDVKAGPCGAVIWMEQTPGGWVRHDVIPKGDVPFYHRAILVDMDGDARKDLVTISETQMPSGKVIWFKGDESADRFEKTRREIGDGGGSFPQVIDIDGDGDLDVASSSFFAPDTAYAWWERTGEPSAAAPAGTWSRHLINNDSGRGFQLELIPNLYGDGVLRAIATNHTNTGNMPPDPIEGAVFGFDIPADPTMLWTKNQLSKGIVSRPDNGLALRDAPGLFGHGDIDGDGDIDIALSGDGDARTWWMEQTGPAQFTMNVIEESLGQAGGCLIDDLDGDSKNELLFTGYEDNVVYLYVRK